MKWAVWGWVLSVVFALFFANIQQSSDVLLDVNKQISYVWAQYVAEASVEKQLLAIKSEDVDKIIKFNEISGQGSQKNAEYGFINEWADSGYFDLELKSTTSADVVLWSIVWWDVSLEWLWNDDFFDTFVLNYNQSTSAWVLVEVIRSDKNGSNFTPCTFYDNVEGNCTYIQKTVVNSEDTTLNGTVIDGLQIYYQDGDNGYDNQIVLQGFNINSYNYRVSFSTLRWESVPFAYYVEWAWEKKKLANNFVEIDTVWTAIDSFARMKLEKRLSNDIQPNVKYALFSDGEIAK